MKRDEIIKSILKSDAEELYTITENGWDDDAIDAMIEAKGLTEDEAIEIVQDCEFAKAYSDRARVDEADRIAKETEGDYDKAWAAAFDSFDHIGDFADRLAERATY